jgi:glycosidase
MLNLLSCHDTRRIFTVFNGEINRLLITIVFLFTFVGIPLIYYGDEIGMAGGEDPDCRRTMVWDESLWSMNINKMYRKMIKIRYSHIALRRGEYKNLLYFNKVFAFKRTYENDEVITILNPGSVVVDLNIPTFSKNIKWFDLFSGNEINSTNEMLNFKKIDPFSYLVLANSELKNR